MSNPFLNQNVDEIFEHHFLEELNKKESRIEKERRIKNQKIYEYKYSKIKDLISFFEKIKSLNLYVKKNSDYDLYQFRMTDDLVPFDFSIRETVEKENYPSPAIFIENPITLEISITNDINIDSLTFNINFFGCQHPDSNLLKSRYKNLNSLTIDLSKFFVKNVYKNDKANN